MTLKLTSEILERFYGSQQRAILVEGIISEIYNQVTEEIREQFSRLEKPLSKDFLEMLSEEGLSIWRSLTDTKNQFFYNLDLFGNGVNTKEAEGMISWMRFAKSMDPEMHQLMIARPEADLYFYSRRRYPYKEIHPLSTEWNWCQFYRQSIDSLVESPIPIELKVGR